MSWLYILGSYLTLIHKFEIIDLKNDRFLSFTVNQKAWVKNILKSLKASNSVYLKKQRDLKVDNDIASKLQFTKLQKLILLPIIQQLFVYLF